MQRKYFVFLSIHTVYSCKKKEKERDRAFKAV